MNEEPTVALTFRVGEESVYARIARVSRTVAERGSERDQFGGIREIGAAHGPRLLEILGSPPKR